MKRQYADNYIEHLVAQALKLGMSQGSYLRIEYKYGFELFGSYETWAGGWEIVDLQVNDKRGFPLTVSNRSLIDGLKIWASKRKELTDDNN